MKLFSCLLLSFSAVMFLLSARTGHYVYAGMLLFAVGVGAYFFLETYGWIDTWTEPDVAKKTSAPDPDFQAGPPLSASEFQQIARAQVVFPDVEPVVEGAPEEKIQFVELPPLKKNQSELHLFDEMTEKISGRERTLVISHFHPRKNTDFTLAGHLMFETNIANILCHEISPNIDLIPYAGTIGPEMSFRAKNFVDAQSHIYQKIVFLLPAEQISLWKMIVNDSPLEGLPHHASLPEV